MAQRTFKEEELGTRGVKMTLDHPVERDVLSDDQHIRIIHCRRQRTQHNNAMNELGA
jgi:hypothetical protein